MDYILETRALSKRYGKTRAVDTVSLHVKKGAIYGLIGRNGAGKSTLLKMIAGLARPTEGSLQLFGSEAGDKGLAFSRIGVLIEHPGLYYNMSARENLTVKLMALGIREKDAADKLLETVGLHDTGKKSVKKFSMGMQQRLGIALALAGTPDLMLLDEPINSLDPQGIAEMRQILERLNREYGITIIISSHILEELAKVATDYGILHEGQLLEELTHQELLEKGGEHIELKTADAPAACAVLEESGIARYKVIDKDTIRIFERLTDSANIAMAMARGHVPLLGIQVKNESLENYFLHLTGGAAHV